MKELPNNSPLESASGSAAPTPLPDDVLSRSDYQGNDNDRKPRINYVKRVFAMSKDELAKETESKIWLSAFAANNPRSDYHWHCTACYDACKRFGDLYDQCYKEASRQ